MYIVHVCMYVCMYIVHVCMYVHCTCMYVTIYYVSCSSTVVTVTVTDVNDNQPELSEVVYHLTLSEATSVESTHSIALLSYTDDDSGSNGVGQYSITGTSEYNIFHTMHM